jgi:hypothetical protein
MCEMDLMNDGRLGRNAKIYDNRVYVCIYQQIHVCCPDRCQYYHDRHDGVCPATGLYHGQVDPERSYVAPDRRTARFKPGLTVLKRATTAEASPLTAEEQNLFFGLDLVLPPPAKQAKYEQEEEAAEPALVPVKIEPGVRQWEDPSRRVRPAPTIVTELPESGFYSFGSTVTKKEAGSGNGNAGGGGGGAKRTGNKTGKKAGSGASAAGKGRKKAVPLSERRDDAEMIVTQLLYSNVRKRINAEKKARLANDQLKAVAEYYARAQAKKKFPVMVDVEEKRARYDVDTPSLRNLKRDEQRIEHYVRIILRTWDIVTKTPWGAQNPGYKFKAHALSVLYKMRMGLKLNDLQLLPFDSYLTHLPNRPDLSHYNTSYNSSMITEGIKHLHSAYESALASGWAPSALSLDTL